eukprot:2768352-Amphidinium_carterae.1
MCQASVLPPSHRYGPAAADHLMAYHTPTRHLDDKCSSPELWVVWQGSSSSSVELHQPKKHGGK